MRKLNCGPRLLNRVSWVTQVCAGPPWPRDEPSLCGTAVGPGRTEGTCLGLLEEKQSFRRPKSLIKRRPVHRSSPHSSLSNYLSVPWNRPVRAGQRPARPACGRHKPPLRRTPLLAPRSSCRTLTGPPGLNDTHNCRVLLNEKTVFFMQKILNRTQS